MKQYATSGMRVLIIEPDVRHQGQLVEYFRSRARTVTAVSSVREAPSLSETTVDVVIGEIEAIGYARAQKELGCSVPGVVIITKNRDQAVAQNHDGIACAILAKPSNPTEVNAVIRQQHTEQ